jgi:hypothetical protein
LAIVCTGTKRSVNELTDSSSTRLLLARLFRYASAPLVKLSPVVEAVKSPRLTWVRALVAMRPST